jgi:hypothetical protein
MLAAMSASGTAAMRSMCCCLRCYAGEFEASTGTEEAWKGTRVDFDVSEHGSGGCAAPATIQQTN